MIKFRICLLLLVWPFDLCAQTFVPDPDWRFNNFNGQTHFVNREIAVSTIDSYGYVWTCGLGVQRFDGYKTNDFNNFTQVKGSLKSNYTDIAADSNGRIWVSSAGLCYYDNDSGRFIYIQADAAHPITRVNSFLVQKKYLWFICDYGLVKLDTHTLKITFTSLKDIVNPLGTYLLDDGTLLISSREKTYIYHIGTDTYVTRTLSYDHSLIKVYALAVNHDHIFLGTNNGLFLLKNLKNIIPTGKGINGAEVDDLLFLPEDKEKKYLLVATDGKGIMVYNTLTGKVESAYTHDVNNPYSLPSNIVSKFYADKNGRIWISTGSGLSMLDMQNQQFKMRFFKSEGSDELDVNKIAPDKFDSIKVWFSSLNQGLIRMDWKTKKPEMLFSADADMQKIRDFVQFGKHKWLLVTQKKLIEWDDGAGVLLKKTLPVPALLNLVYIMRRAIIAGNNTCFITTNKGLFKYDMKAHRLSVASQDTSGDHDPLKYDLHNGFYDNGIVWVASRNGLFSYNTKTKKTKIYKGKGSNADYYLFNITQGPAGQIICATGNGITIFDQQTGNFKVVNTIAGLFKPDCENVIVINNTVWIDAEAGILTYNLQTHASAKAGLETTSAQIFPGSPFTFIDGSIVLGFRNGYTYFKPDIKKASMPSKPLIERVYVNNQPVSLQNTPRLELDHLNNSVNIVFTAFLYDDPGQIDFRYRLKGADTKWQYAVDQRSANYAQLPAGEYSFEVESGNKNGIWNISPASFGFTIHLPFWETWWFRLSVLLTVAFGLYQLYRYRIRHILAIERIRERIASDFHDDIGSALSSISIFSEVADKQLQQQQPAENTREIIRHISLHSRNMLDAMDDIIWAVNPQNDHLIDLTVRMREFAIPLLEAKNIRFDIDIEEDILNTRIKMEARKNVFLIFKECINNIIKHSGCTAMTVKLKKLNNQLQLIISDNGMGFDPDAANNRNGLKNMQKRAAEINGTIKVKTKTGSGTVITLLINTI